MVFFQLFNTCIATLTFLFLRWTYPTTTTSCPIPPIEPLPAGVSCFDPSAAFFDFRPTCVSHWYMTGSVVLTNVLFGDMTVILGIIEFIRPDKWIIRYLIAPRAHTQAQMNEIYKLDSDFYLPFRYQLVLKSVCVAFIFCSAIPLLLPMASLFCAISYKIDRYNLLRVFKPPPRTTERAVVTGVLYILPLGVFGHVLLAMFFYSKQAGTPVPFVYYCIVLLLALVVMSRISAELRAHSQRAHKRVEADSGAAWAGVYGAHSDGDPAAHASRDGFSASMFTEMEAAGHEARPDRSQLRACFESVDFYVPPLSSTLLRSMHVDAAAKASTRAGGQGSAALSPRGGAGAEAAR